MNPMISQDVVKVSTAWCKRNDKASEPPTQKSDNNPIPPRASGHPPPRNQTANRGGGSSTRGSKYGSRSGQFRCDNYYNRGAKRTDNHVSADSSINWRRSETSKSSRSAYLFINPCFAIPLQTLFSNYFVKNCDVTPLARHSIPSRI